MCACISFLVASVAVRGLVIITRNSSCLAWASIRWACHSFRCHSLGFNKWRSPKEELTKPGEPVCTSVGLGVDRKREGHRKGKFRFCTLSPPPHPENWPLISWGCVRFVSPGLCRVVLPFLSFAAFLLLVAGRSCAGGLGAEPFLVTMVGDAKLQKAGRGTTAAFRIVPGPGVPIQWRLWPPKQV